MTETAEGDDDGRTSVFIYNGFGEIPRAITRLKVDSSVKFIPSATCSYCVQLVQVELPEGLEMICGSAFALCKSLKTIIMPSTVTKIGVAAFANCHMLQEIALPQGLLTLEEEAFEGCRSLQTIHIPPLVQAIESGVFRGCTSLTEVLLPVDLQEIKESAFQNCKSLTFIDFPSNLKVVGTSSFYGTDLSEFNLPDTVNHCDSFCEFNLPNFRLPSLIANFDLGMTKGSLVSLELPENVKEVTIPRYVIGHMRNIDFPDRCNVVLDGISGRWPTRFKGLPVHQICYYHSYHHTGKVLLDLKRELHPWSTETRCGKLSDTGRCLDTDGMTPLHILACSTKHNMEMYRLLVEKYPENLTVVDQWGDLPLTYAFICNAPIAIINFLLDSYTSKHPDFELNWEEIADSVIYMRAPLHRLHILFETHQRYFPHREIDLKSVILSRVVPGIDQGCYNVHEEIIKFLLRASITKRMDVLNVNQWRSILEERICLISQMPERLEEHVCRLYSELDVFEWKKEIAPLLELALWKAALADRCCKKARIGYADVSYKTQCHVKCGANIVIWNVFNFIGSDSVSITSHLSGFDESDFLDSDYNSEFDDSVFENPEFDDDSTDSLH